MAKAKIKKITKKSVSKNKAPMSKMSQEKFDELMARLAEI